MAIAQTDTLIFTNEEEEIEAKEVNILSKIQLKSNNIKDAESIQEIENSFNYALNLIRYWTQQKYSEKQKI